MDVPTLSYPVRHLHLQALPGERNIRNMCMSSPTDKPCDVSTAARHRRVHQDGTERRCRPRRLLPERRTRTGRGHQILGEQRSVRRAIRACVVTRTAYPVQNRSTMPGSAEAIAQARTLLAPRTSWVSMSQRKGARTESPCTHKQAGVKDMRFQALMPDILHWFGIQKVRPLRRDDFA